MKPKKKLCLKVMSLVMACVLSLQFATSAFAKSTDWQLNFDPSRPPAENLRSWEETVHADLKSTKVEVLKIGGGSKINAYSSNGIDSDFTRPGSASTKASVGAKIELKIKYVESGTSSNKPHGFWEY